MILRSPIRQRQAATLVEMAVVSLVCFTFMFALFEYGRYVFVRQTMENAARSGARTAVILPTSYLPLATANANIGTAVTDAMATTPVVNTAWTAYQADNTGNNIGSWTATSFGKNVVVQVDADLPLLFPFFGFIKPGAAPNTIHVKVVSMMRSEAN